MEVVWVAMVTDEHHTATARVAAEAGDTETFVCPRQCG